MKYILRAFFVFVLLAVSHLLALAQVGVMTTAPLSTLHVASTADVAIADGIRVSQLTLVQLRAKMNASRYTAANHVGTILYISAIDGAPNAQMTEITTPGHYYFDGTIWKRFAYNRSQFFYLPPIELNITQAMVTSGQVQTINLYNVIQRFNSAVNTTHYHTSNNNLTRLPATTLGIQDFYYVVTYYDRDAITVNSITVNGLLSYTPLSISTGVGSFMTVVAIPK